MAVKTPMLTNAKAGELTALGSPGALWRSLVETPLLTLGALVVGAVSLLGFVSASPAMATVGLSVHTFTDPTHFSAKDQERCNSEEERCDRYQLVIRNVGDTASSAPIEVVDKLPD